MRNLPFGMSVAISVALVLNCSGMVAFGADPATTSDRTPDLHAGQSETSESHTQHRKTADSADRHAVHSETAGSADRHAVHSKTAGSDDAEATVSVRAQPKKEAHTDCHSDFSGHAHYYGKGFHGKRTASGAVFDKEKMTAAHPSLPFGTKVRVRSAHTGKEVVVTITDRCPHMKQRCIDLSEGAARTIGLYPSAPSGVDCAVLKK